MSLAMGSVSVGLTATPVPLAATSPGSLTLIWSGANPLTLGGANVVAGQAQPGQATIPGAAANTAIVIPIAKLGGLAQGALFGVTTVAVGTLSWFYGTEIS